jgi:DNA (cytosine-5)-methyltransferase 1
MRILDLFCAAGGATRGYQMAFPDATVVGVDISPQPNYVGHRFFQADVMEVLANEPFMRTFQLIHASPPCPSYSTITPAANRASHPDLYVPVRDRLIELGIPWVIENVIGAPYRSGVVLCGSMFGLRVRRHRNFESSHLLSAPCGCRHKEQGEVLGVYGDGGGGKSTRPSGGGGTKAHRREFAELMGMPWATPAEIVLAIPPVYCEWIGRQFAASLEVAA